VSWYSDLGLSGTIVAEVVGRGDDDDFVVRCDTALSFVVGPAIRAYVGSDFDARMTNDASRGGIYSVAVTATLRIAQGNLDGVSYLSTDGGYAVRRDQAEPSFTPAEETILNRARKRTFP
jgi:hypothetical protein